MNLNKKSFGTDNFTVQAVTAPQKTQQRIKKRWVFGALGLMGVYFGVCLVLAVSILSPRTGTNAVPEGYKQFAISSDQYPIWVLASKDLATGESKSKRIVVFAHDSRGQANDWLPIMDALQAKGIETCAIYMAGSSRSATRMASFGPKESQEILGVIRWVRDHSAIESRVAVVGAGSGGTAAWLAAGTDPDQIDALITDSASARVGDMAEANAIESLAQSASIFSPTRWFIRQMISINSKKQDPLVAAGGFTRNRSLVVHAKDDSVVPFTQARAFLEHGGGRLWEFESGEHAKLLTEHPKESAQKIQAMLSN